MNKKFALSVAAACLLLISGGLWIKAAIPQGDFPALLSIANASVANATAGYCNLFLDATGGNVWCKNSSGTNVMPSGGSSLGGTLYQNNGQDCGAGVNSCAYPGFTLGAGVLKAGGNPGSCLQVEYMAQETAGNGPYTIQFVVGGSAVMTTPSIPTTVAIANGLFYVCNDTGVQNAQHYFSTYALSLLPSTAFANYLNGVTSAANFAVSNTVTLNFAGSGGEHFVTHSMRIVQQ
jgi:hypothetical protein